MNEWFQYLDDAVRGLRYTPDGWAVFDSGFSYVPPPPPPPFSYVPPLLDEARPSDNHYNALGFGNTGFSEWGVPDGSKMYLILGNTSTGYGIEKDDFGKAYIVRYINGVQLRLGTINLPNDNEYHTFRLSIVAGLITNQIEASIDGVNIGIFNDNSISLVGNSWPVSLNAGGSGKARHFHSKMAVSHHTALPASAKAAFDMNGKITGPIYDGVTTVGSVNIVGVVAAAADANASFVAHATIFGDQIAWLGGGTPTGPVSLSMVPDDATNSKVETGDITGGHITATYNTIWNSANVNQQADGQMGGFPASTLVSTNTVYPIATGQKLVASGWAKAGGTSNTVMFIVGDDLNGYGLNWSNTGVLTFVCWQVGVKSVLHTFTSVTMDILQHWYAVAVVPGATPGTGDTVEAYFDTQHYAPGALPGGSIVTWGATAPCSIQLGGSGGKVNNYRITGQTL